MLGLSAAMSRLGCPEVSTLIANEASNKTISKRKDYPREQSAITNVFDHPLT